MFGKSSKRRSFGEVYSEIERFPAHINFSHSMLKTASGRVYSRKLALAVRVAYYNHQSKLECCIADASAIGANFQGFTKVILDPTKKEVDAWSPYI